MNMTSGSSTSPQHKSLPRTTAIHVDDRVDEVDGKTSARPNHLASVSLPRKSVLLLFFCTAMFIDIAGVSATFLMTAPIAHDLKVSSGNMVWILGSYSLAFASTLLFGGRLADLYSPGRVFAFGFFGQGVFYLVISFMNNQYSFLVLRAISALLAVLTIPSSINMIVQMYPEPEEQAKKLAVFSMSSAIANTIALILAGVFLLASWRWYFRFVAIVSIPVALAAWFLLPKTDAVAEDLPGAEKWKRMDLGGVIGLMSILILFILAFTQVTSSGWDSAIFIAPLVISVCLLPVWLYWQHRLPNGYSLIPNDIWTYPNIFPLIVQGTSVFMFFATYQLRIVTYWQEAMGISPIMAAVRLLPMGITCFIVGVVTQALPVLILRPRFVQPVSSALCFAGTMLLAYSNGGRGNDYWKFIFTGEIIGSIGGMLNFIGMNTNIIQSFPVEFAGVGGSFAQVIFQVGGIVGIAIQQGLVDTGNGTVQDYTGSKNGYIFVSVWVLTTGLIFVAGYRQHKMPEHTAPGATAA